jgi:GH15 family glucan-1,4-alpha-glucosidase
VRTHLCNVFCLLSQGSKIDEYGLIGDCRSAALVSKYGSIDWLCWPRFDSPSIFAAILDRDKGGRWSISPKSPFRVERAYIQDSNVLETRFICSGGRASLTDLMPVSSEEFKRGALLPDHQLIRQLRCTEGQVEFQFEFFPRSHYGSRSLRIRQFGALGLQMDVGRAAYRLLGTVPLCVQEDRATVSLTLTQGNDVQFSLTYSEDAPAVLPALGGTIRETIDRSVQWWKNWASRCRYHGPYENAVRRSALALKLLAYAPSGAIVAALIRVRLDYFN